MNYILQTQESEEWGDLLCDPGALPADFDERFLQPPRRRESWKEFEGRNAQQFAELTAAGQGCWIEGFRGCTLLAFINEQMPKDLAPFTGPPTTIEALSVPTGRLCFANAGAVARPESLQKDSWQGQSVAIPVGIYRATVYRMEYPLGFHDGLLKIRTSPREYRLYRAACDFFLVAVGAVVLLLLSFLIARLCGGLDIWTRYMLPIGLVLVCMPYLVGQWGPARRAMECAAKIREQFPDVVAVLESAQAGSIET
jgi:hypothetical protein